MVGRERQALPSDAAFPGSDERLSARVFFRVTAEPEWGIEKDMIFGGIITKGTLDDLRFFNEDEVKEKAEVILAASPQEWKLLLRKEHKFITDVMLTKIKLEKGSIANVWAVTPYADAFIDAITQVNLQFQDELSPQQLDEYRKYASEFRARLGV
jgi:hypothetical protein